MKFILLVLLGSAVFFGTPEREVRITESFLGSNNDGDVYYTLESVGDNTGTYYASASSERLAVHRKTNSESFETSHSLLSQMTTFYPGAEPGSQRRNFRHYGKEFQFDDLLTSSTIFRFALTAEGLMARHNDRVWCVYSPEEIQRAFFLGCNAWGKSAERFSYAHRARDYFFATVEAKSLKKYDDRFAYITGTFVVPIPTERVLGPTTDTLTRAASRPVTCATTRQTKR